MRWRVRALLPSVVLVALAVPAGLAVAEVTNSDSAPSALEPASACPKAAAYVEDQLGVAVDGFGPECPDLAQLKTEVDAEAGQREELVKEFAPDCREALAKGIDFPTCEDFVQEQQALNAQGGN